MTEKECHDHSNAHGVFGGKYSTNWCRELQCKRAARHGRNTANLCSRTHAARRRDGYHQKKKKHHGSSRHLSAQTGDKSVLILHAKYERQNRMHFTNGVFRICFRTGSDPTRPDPITTTTLINKKWQSVGMSTVTPIK